jgi:hypothetical protein
VLVSASRRSRLFFESSRSGMVPNGKKVGDRGTRSPARETRALLTLRHPRCAYFDILLYRETFAAGTVCNCVWIGDLEAAFLQILAVIEHRAANKKRAFWIDDEAHV